MIKDWTKHSPLNFYGLFEQDNLDKISPFNSSPKSDFDKALIQQAEIMDKVIRDYLEEHNLTAQDWVNNGRIEKVPTAQSAYSLSWKVRFYYKDERII